MDADVKRALVAAARAFADELDREPLPTSQEALAQELRWDERLHIVLQRFVQINDQQGRGLSIAEMRELARRIGISSRGMAGYYAGGYIEARDGSRWITQKGRDQLAQLNGSASTG